MALTWYYRPLPLGAQAGLHKSRQGKWVLMVHEGVWAVL